MLFKQKIYVNVKRWYSVIITFKVEKTSYTFHCIYKYKYCHKITSKSESNVDPVSKNQANEVTKNKVMLKKQRTFVTNMQI